MRASLLRAEELELSELVVLRLPFSVPLASVLPPPKRRLKKPPEESLLEVELSLPVPLTPLLVASEAEVLVALSFIFCASSVPSLASVPPAPSVLSEVRELLWLSLVAEE